MENPSVLETGVRSLNPFLFIKNKRLFISSEGFSTLIKTPCYFISGPIQAGVTAFSDSNGRLATFSFEFKLSGLGVTALC